MEVTVNMSAEEFLEFMAWQKDRNHYNAEMAAQNRKWEMLANKACWAHRERSETARKGQDRGSGTRGRAAGAGK